MSEKKEEKRPLENYQGYQPIQGDLDTSNPPQSGSGVSPSGQNDDQRDSSKD